MTTLYLVKYTVLEHARSDCMIAFGGMTAEDDEADTGPDVTLLGRWSAVSGSYGWCMCRATTVRALNAWLLNWTSLANIEVSPMLDDNQARAIVLESPPPFQVEYDRVGSEALEGETLYLVTYTFLPGKREEGYKAFANMTQAQDTEDAGKNTCFGRWHNLGTGTGIALCSSPSEVDVYTWAFHWASMCDCVVQPVLTDASLRANVKQRPDFEAKHAALMKPAARRFWWGRS